MVCPTNFEHFRNNIKGILQFTYECNMTRLQIKVHPVPKLNGHNTVRRGISKIKCTLTPHTTKELHCPHKAPFLAFHSYRQSAKRCEEGARGLEDVHKSPLCPKMCPTRFLDAFSEVLKTSKVLRRLKTSSIPRSL